jgi:hypothetical protein
MGFTVSTFLMVNILKVKYLIKVFTGVGLKMQVDAKSELVVDIESNWRKDRK